MVKSPPSDRELRWRALDALKTERRRVTRDRGASRREAAVRPICELEDAESAIRLRDALAVLAGGEACLALGAVAVRFFLGMRGEVLARHLRMHARTANRSVAAGFEVLRRTATRLGLEPDPALWGPMTLSALGEMLVRCVPPPHDAVR